MITATIAVQYGPHKVTTTGPVVFDDNMDLGDLFAEMINNGYSPNAFHCGLIKAITERIKVIDDCSNHFFDREQRSAWCKILLALQPEEE